MRLQASVAKATAVGNPGEYRVTSRPVCRTPKTRTPPFPSASRTLHHQPQIEAFLADMQIHRSSQCRCNSQSVVWSRIPLSAVNAKHMCVSFWLAQGLKTEPRNGFVIKLRNRFIAERFVPFSWEAILSPVY